MGIHHIRAVEKRDLGELVQLCAAHAAYEECAYNSLYKAQDLATHLFGQSPALQCLVVELDGQLIGYATFMKQFSTWDTAFYVYMDCLYLTEAARNLGIGKELMEKVKYYAKEEKCDHIQWQTPKSNTEAIRFYRALGAESKEKERFFLYLGGDP